jgi:hypothetical protein
MPVSLECGFVFVHLVKTGGMSIVQSLRAAGVELDFVGSPLNERLRGCPKAQADAVLSALRHSRAFIEDAVLDHLPALALREFLGDRWQGLFKFSIVRNPWDLFVSLYAYGKAELERAEIERRNVFSDHVRRSESFESFVLNFPRDGPDFCDSLCDETGTDMMDFIGRFENLESDFAQICERIGLDAPLVHINASDHGNYADYYTAKSRAHVGRRFARDIDRFGYRF